MRPVSPAPGAEYRLPVVAATGIGRQLSANQQNGTWPGQLWQVDGILTGLVLLGGPDVLTGCLRPSLAADGRRAG